MHGSDIFSIIEEAVEVNSEGIIISELILMIRKKLPGLKRNAITEAIRTMNENGSIMYLSRLGQTMISRNINKPIKISERIWISPPSLIEPSDMMEGSLNIKINPGIAFGNGIHPTTKLCIKSIDKVFKEEKGNIENVLDIGTGTGVLAIAASLLGAENVHAVDIDSCARKEAFSNLEINGLTQNKIVVSDKQIEDIFGEFDLVLANLRSPTLANLADPIKNKLKINGYAVFSGFRPEEKRMVIEYYSDLFSLYDEEDKNGWSSIILKKR